MSKCRWCGKEINWIKTPAGKAMPVDIETITVVTVNGEVVKGHMPHWATCPAAQQFKKRLEGGK